LRRSEHSSCRARSALALVPQLEHPIATTIAAVGRGETIEGHVLTQHVGAMTAGPSPHADHALLCGTTEGDVFRRGAVCGRHALAKASVVEPLAPGKILRVAIGGTGERFAWRERTQAVLSPKRIEIECKRSCCKQNASGACTGPKDGAPIPFSNHAGRNAPAVSTSTNMRCSRHRHGGCS